MKTKDTEAKIKVLEDKNKDFYKMLKSLQKKTLGLLWIWNFLPIFGPLVWLNLKFKRLSEEPYRGEAIRIKVEIAKNEMEIIKLRKIKQENH